MQFCYGKFILSLGRWGADAKVFLPEFMVMRVKLQLWLFSVDCVNEVNLCLAMFAGLASQEPSFPMPIGYTLIFIRSCCSRPSHWCFRRGFMNIGRWGRARASAYAQGLRRLECPAETLTLVWSVFCSAQCIWTQPVELCYLFGLVFTGSVSGVLTPEETLSVYQNGNCLFQEWAAVPLGNSF